MRAFCFPSDVEPQQTLADLYVAYKSLLQHALSAIGFDLVYVAPMLFMKRLTYHDREYREHEHIEFHSGTQWWCSTVIGQLYPDGTFSVTGEHRRGDHQRHKVVTLMPWLDWGWHNGTVIWYPTGYWGSTRNGPEIPRTTTCLPLGMTGIPDRALRARWVNPRFKVVRNRAGYAEFQVAEESLGTWALGPKRSTDRLSPRSNNMYLGNLVNEDAAAKFATFLEVKDVHHLAPLYCQDPEMAAAQ